MKFEKACLEIDQHFGVELGTAGRYVGAKLAVTRSLGWGGGRVPGADDWRWSEKGKEGEVTLLKNAVNPISVC